MAFYLCERWKRTQGLIQFKFWMIGQSLKMLCEILYVITLHAIL